jgi:hypothetical protein
VPVQPPLDVAVRDDALRVVIGNISLTPTAVTSETR